jgi:hypothetical protein
MKALTTYFGVKKTRDKGHSGVRPGFVVGLFALMAIFPDCCFAGPMLSLTVRVFNYAPVSPPALAAAERDANQILAAAGVQVVWLDCLQEVQDVRSKAVCEMGWNQELPSVRLLSGQVTKQFQGSEFGFSLVPVLVTVNYEHIANRALRDNSFSEASILLGCVIAHELGHLLLGSDSHSSVGIMQSHWGRDQVHQAQTGNLRFAPEQVLQLRENVRLLADRQQGMFAKMALIERAQSSMPTSFAYQKRASD